MDTTARIRYLAPYVKYLSLKKECRPVLEKDKHIRFENVKVKEGDFLTGAFGVQAILMNPEKDEDQPANNKTQRSKSGDETKSEEPKEVDELLQWRVPKLGVEGDGYSGPVYFFIRARKDDRTYNLLKESLCPEEKKEDRRWRPYRISLDRFSGEEIDLEFLLKDEGMKTCGVWSVPGIENEKKELRDRRKRPNLIIICLDTLRRDHLHCCGYPRNLSPEIDRFSKNCLFFSNMRSVSSWTLPSMISILTGLEPHQHQTISHIDPGLPVENRYFLAEFFHNAGYRTAAFTDGGYVSPVWGFSRGFDLYHADRIGAKRIFESARDWIQEKELLTPFFLFLHTYEIHDPYNTHTGQKIFSRGRAKLPLARRQYNDVPYDLLIDHYDDGIRYTDALVGDFFRFLISEGLYDSSGIIIHSDHGEQFGEHGGVFHGKTVFREAMEIPFMFKTPYDSFPPKIIDQPAASTSVMPFLSEMYGLDKAKKAFDYDIKNIDHCFSDHVICGFGKKRADIVVSAEDTKQKVIWDSSAGFEVYDTVSDPAEQVPLKPGRDSVDLMIDSAFRGSVSGPGRFLLWHRQRDSDETLSFELETSNELKDIMTYASETSIVDKKQNGETISMTILHKPETDIGLSGLTFASESKIILKNLRINDQVLKKDQIDILLFEDQRYQHFSSDGDGTEIELYPLTFSPEKKLEGKKEAVISLIYYQTTEKESKSKPEIDEELQEQLKYLGYALP